MSPYETPARMVRTGLVIKVPADGYRRSLEVAVVHHTTHNEPGSNDRTPVVWFSGWTDDGWVERGWGQKADARVLVVEDRRGGDTYLEVSAGITTEVIA